MEAKYKGYASVWQWEAYKDLTQGNIEDIRWGEQINMWIAAVGPCSPRVIEPPVTDTRHTRHTPLPPRLSAWRAWRWSPTPGGQGHSDTIVTCSSRLLLHRDACVSRQPARDTGNTEWRATYPQSDRPCLSSRTGWQVGPGWGTAPANCWLAHSRRRRGLPLS